jgi:NAD(P)-dependent dehydrogenase (short-subunit alcohol dehydrogenase family)
MGQLDGRVIIVTGAAQGIGSAYAEGLAQEGAKVVAADIVDSAPIVERIQSAGGAAISVVADITDEVAIKRMVTETQSAFGGRIDGLINNAALFVSLPHCRFEDIDIDAFDDVMRVNIRSVWQMTRAVTPIMRQQKYGKIVNIASTTALKGTPMQIHYVVSKGAVIAMTRCLAKELGNDNVCVNAIAPGLTKTDHLVAEARYAEDYFESNGAARSLGRVGRPGDLVGTAVFLTSGASDFMTGQTVVVDGGGVFH